MVEGWIFDIGLDPLSHLPQEVIATVDVADAVHPHAIRDPTRTRSWSGCFLKPLQQQMHPRHEVGPRPLGLIMRRGHPCARKRIQTALRPHFSAHPLAREAIMPPAEAQNGAAQRVPRSPS